MTAMTTVEELAANPSLANDWNIAAISNVFATCAAAIAATVPRILEIAIQRCATAQQPIGDTLINAREAAKRIGISRSTFYVRARAGKYPFVVKDCGEIKASVHALDTWIKLRMKMQAAPEKPESVSK